MRLLSVVGCRVLGVCGCWVPRTHVEPVGWQHCRRGVCICRLCGGVYAATAARRRLPCAALPPGTSACATVAAACCGTAAVCVRVRRSSGSNWRRCRGVQLFVLWWQLCSAALPQCESACAAVVAACCGAAAVCVRLQRSSGSSRRWCRSMRPCGMQIRLCSAALPQRESVCAAVVAAFCGGAAVCVRFAAGVSGDRRPSRTPPAVRCTPYIYRRPPHTIRSAPRARHHTPHPHYAHCAPRALSSHIEPVRHAERKRALHIRGCDAIITIEPVR